jgi:hypothetical protein
VRKKSVHASRTSARTGWHIDRSSTHPLVLSVSKGEQRFFLTTTEFAESECFLIKNSLLGVLRAAAVQSEGYTF